MRSIADSAKAASAPISARRDGWAACSLGIGSGDNGSPVFGALVIRSLRLGSEAMADPSR
jgi:hypothetical protein